jgi:hypothetical protein
MCWLVNNPYPNLKGLSPAAADLDKDGDDDLVVGNFLGTLSYFENQAPTSAGMPANFQLVPNYFGNLDVGANSAPQLFDIDKDSDFDLFIGNDKGYISFYQNNGTAFVPDFSLVTLKWGKVKINDLQGGVGSLGYSRPSFMDLDGDTQPELIVGTIYGQLQIFTNLTTSATDSFPFIGHFQNFDFGSYASPSIAIIDTSRTPVFIVGTQRGGLQLFKKPYHPEPTVSIQTAAGATPFLRLFPNPTSQYFTLQTASSQTEPIDFHIYNISGQDVFASSSVLPTANHYHCVIPPLPNGLYFVKIQYQGKYYTQKLVISSF